MCCFLTVLEGLLGEVMRTCLVSVEDTEEAEDTTALSSSSSLLEDSPEKLIKNVLNILCDFTVKVRCKIAKQSLSLTKAFFVLSFLYFFFA
jgi:hypothetical protein